MTGLRITTFNLLHGQSLTDGSVDPVSGTTRRK